MNTYFRVHVYANGVKNRCRKVDRHQLVVGKFPVTVTKEELQKYCREVALKEMKTLAAEVLCSASYITASDDGFFEQWEPFSGKDIKFKFSVKEVQQ